MSTLYVYSVETNQLVARINGEQAACEAIAADRFADDYGTTYNPAFGFVGGVDAGDNVEDIEA